MASADYCSIGIGAVAGPVSFSLFRVCTFRDLGPHGVFIWDEVVNNGQTWDFPGGPVAKTLALPKQGAWVRFLVM